MRAALVGFVALFSLLGCASPGGPEPGPEGVVVELDAFSGLPNPRWALSSGEAGELAVRLRSLPPADDARLPEGGLGYRGFRIHNPGGAGGIADGTYVARGGLVEVEGALRRDVRGAEAWLADLARRHGYGEVVSR